MDEGSLGSVACIYRHILLSHIKGIRATSTDFITYLVKVILKKTNIALSHMLKKKKNGVWVGFLAEELKADLPKKSSQCTGRDFKSTWPYQE